MPMKTPKTTIPAEVREAILKTNLAYLFNETEAYERTLAEPRAFSLHDGCQILSAGVLPAGTKVWGFRHPRVHYSEYRWIGDEQYPAKGAKIFTTGADWTLITIVDGKPADAYVATEPTEPTEIGVLS